MTQRHSVVIHGHFYQPPREDPWTGEVPPEPSAAPYHDWNRRIHDECYRAVVAARVLDARGRIASVVNTLEWISWDAGPTMLSWLEREEPGTYRAFLEADARSLQRLGHGNALATPYHHVILPLASRRDKITEVRWGIRDFRHRFGRDPVGMWLPEAAVDLETLEVLALEGIRFTILGPDQVKRPPDHGLPGRVQVGGGRQIAVFVYDGSLSHDVAFGTLLRDARVWVARMAEGPGLPRLTVLATDGETFGHHHRWGDMALAAAVQRLRATADVQVENLAAFLDGHDPVEDLAVLEPSSWSCAHGVDRWRSDCGCKMAPERSSQQLWRAPLREGLVELAADLHGIFESEADPLLEDPWRVRDDYGGLLDAEEAERRAFVADRAKLPLDDAATQRLLDLLEMERDALRAFTSCGWFFDDVAGLEPLQVLRYAAHALDLAGPAAAGLEDRLRARLERARSNDPEEGTGRRLWDEVVRGRTEDPSPLAVSTSAGPEALGQALVRAVGALAGGARGERVADVGACLDRLAEEGLPAPFEAQTAFWRAVQSAGAEDLPALDRLAERLGFGPDVVRARSRPARAPLRFVFGVHVHQPVGNFDHVIREHAEQVYEPFLRRLAREDCLPIALHVSGPLLEWLEVHHHPYLDLVGELASAGRVELLLSGFYEPILPALMPSDRVGQIEWMRDWMRSRWGVEATGLWLTERVWEPDLPADLARAGVRYVLVDDRHFSITGFEQRQLHRPYRTEFAGKTLDLIPIDERLRYLVPFRPPAELATYFRDLLATGHRAAVLADDGEKFGGWPGTAEWVWEAGWLDRFLGTLRSMIEGGELRMSTPSELLESVPSGGLAYVPSASYREMEGWSLTPVGARRLEALDEALEAGDLDPGSRALIRGGHWRNFLARYPESNRMHKKAQALSALCRRRGDPTEARRAIGRAQCNDAYWHGVFGGLYLRHLREAVWSNLAHAEEILRDGEGAELEALDLFGHGSDELWIHASTFSAVVSPARGGAVEELTCFRARRNLADVLTRRREAYHRAGPSAPAEPVPGNEDDGSMPSIHDAERGLRFDTLPPLDGEHRAILVDRVLPEDLDEAEYAGGGYRVVRSWAREEMHAEWGVGPGGVEVLLRASSGGALVKRLRFDPSGAVEVAYRWDRTAFPADAWFAPEMSLAWVPRIDYRPLPAILWRHDICTVSKSERGAEESVQGVSLTPLWPAAVGGCGLTLHLGPI